MTAQEYIHHLQLQPHPEGGYFKETYRSSGEITQHCLGANFSGNRNYATAIYYLLQQGDFSAFHRIQSDEGWHFYAGGTLWIHVLDAKGIYRVVTLGNRLQLGEQFQFVVPATAWFAAEPASRTTFALVGCTVAPGFDFADFEMADKQKLSEVYPQHQKIIQRLCR